MRLFLRITSVLGLAAFGLAFLATFLSPLHFERAARTYLTEKVEAQVGVIADRSEVKALDRWAQKLTKEKKSVEDLRLLVATLTASTVERMQQEDCACRLAGHLDAHLSRKASKLDAGIHQLAALAQGKYVEVVHRLMLDLRLFFGSNALAFGLVLLVSVLRKEALRPLMAPAALLLASTVVCSAFYLFGQNWFFTVIFGSYLGLAYAAWLLVVFALLCDIGLNRARVTSNVLGSLVDVAT